MLTGVPRESRSSLRHHTITRSVIFDPTLSNTKLTFPIVIQIPSKRPLYSFKPSLPCKSARMFPATISTYAPAFPNIFCSLISVTSPTARMLVSKRSWRVCLTLMWPVVLSGLGESVERKDVAGRPPRVGTCWWYEKMMGLWKV